MGVVHIELFENDFQNGLLSKVRILASVLLCCPPVETVDDNRSDSTPLFHINTQVSAQTCLIFGVDREGAVILWRHLVWAEAVRGATWPIRHPKPSVGFFVSLQVADRIVKNGLMVSA